MNTAFRRSLFLDSDTGDVPAGGQPDSPAPSAPAPSPESTGQSANTQPEFRVPQGYRLASEQDWTAREAAYERARKLGIDSEDGFKEYSTLADTARSRGLKLSQLAAMLGAGGQQPQQGKKSDDSGKSMEQLKAELKAETMAEWRREQALSDHMKREEGSKKFVDDMVKEMLGGQDDEVMGPLLRDAITQRLYQERTKGGIPQDHPLHGEVLGLYTDELFDNFKKSHGELGTKLQGWQLKKIGEAANKAKGSAPVTTGSKAAGNDGAKGDGRELPMSKWTDEQKKAYAAEIAQRVRA